MHRIKQSFETGTPWEDTFPLRGRDGHYRWFLSRALPIRDDTGNVVRWFGTNTDITEQIEAETSLKDILASARCFLWHSIVSLKADGGFEWAFDIGYDHDSPQWFPIVRHPGEWFIDAWVRSVNPDDHLLMDRLSNATLDRLPPV